MKDVLSMTTFITGMFSSLLGAALLYLAGPFLLVLTILKLVGALTIDWFGYPAILSVVGTPFWMVAFGLLILLLAMVLMAASTEVAEKRKHV